jgi:tRNA threonylcarbamoyladenosine biosynthesis protein TsaE
MRGRYRAGLAFGGWGSYHQPMEFHDLDETMLAARATALAPQLRAGDVLFLRGDLGAGKTVFARALIRALTDDPDMNVPSPTFTLVQTYDTSAGPLWHFDLYRLKSAEEIYEIGWEDALGGAIMVVEWPERLGTGDGNSLAPQDRLELVLSIAPDNNARRRLRLEPHGQWKDRI